MSNIFSSIYRANDALTAARFGLDVTSQNIANANTPGYTRQRAEQVAMGQAVGVPTLHSGQINDGGVQAKGATRLGDAVLDTRTRAEHARSAAVDTNAARLADIENIFREPSDTGLAEQLHDYWNAWGDVANDPGGRVPREMLISAADKTVTMLHSMNSALDDVATAAQSSLDDQVASANADATALSELNRKIAIGSASGANINSLLDQRDVLLDNLSQSVGGVATIHNNGTVTVTVGSEELVSVGNDQNGKPGGPPFTAAAFDAHVIENSPTDVDVEFTVGGVTVTLADSRAASEAKALSETVPTYRNKLDDVARALADTVNDMQASGFDINESEGEAMFSDGAEPPAGPSFEAEDITAANITVAISDWQKIAAAGGREQRDGNGDPVLDGNGDPVMESKGALDASNALAASLMGSDPDAPDTAYASLIGDLGRASSSAQQQRATQNVITASVDTLKSTASGVSFDEEVANMLTYQMAFQASSRVLTTLDSMLDTLINRTGLVGR